VRTAILTREFPPDIYGGAGVHVDYLVRELRKLVDVDVHAFGGDRDGATGHRPAPDLAEANFAVATLSVDLSMAAATGDADLVHSHTWYANMAGHWSKLLYGVPHVVTAHSLEPRRPWKAEQLGGGYRVSSWAESTAYHGADAVVAVSQGMRADILDCYPDLDPGKVHVILNGIDTQIYQPTFDRTLLIERGVDLEAPIASFVGRITRQKGVGHLIAAAHEFDPEVQLVLCAGAPDTPEIAAETAEAVHALQAARPNVFWFDGMLTLDRSNRSCRPRRCSVARRCTNRWVSSIWRPWPVVRRWWPAMSAAFPRWLRTGSPGTWCTTTRPNRRRSGRTSPPP